MRLKAEKILILRGYKRCEQCGGIISKFILFSIQWAMKPAYIWLLCPLIINKCGLPAAFFRVFGLNTFCSHFKLILFEVQPFSLILKCQFLNVLSGNQSELKCLSFYIIIGGRVSSVMLIYLIFITYSYFPTIYLFLYCLFK